MDSKVVFSAKLLRKLVHLDEGDVCYTFFVTYYIHEPNESMLQNELLLVHALFSMVISWFIQSLHRLITRDSPIFEF